MKVFLRVVVVILLLVGIGFGTYFVFFKPANKDEVFLKLTQIAEYESKSKYKENLEAISYSKFAPSDDVFKNVLKEKRGYLTTNDKDDIKFQDVEYRIIVGKDGANNVYEDVNYQLSCLPVIKGNMDGIFNYYFAYSQAVNKTVKKSELKKITKAIDEYRTSLNNLNNSLIYIKSLQDKISEDAGNVANNAADLSGRYTSAIRAHNVMLHEYSELIEAVKNFVIVHVFSGEMIADRDAILYDVMIKAINKATANYEVSDVEILAPTAYDYYYSYMKIQAVTISGNRNSVISANHAGATYNGMMASFNKILKEAPETIGKLVNLTYKEKQMFGYNKGKTPEEMSTFDKNAEFVETLHSDILNILQSYGIKA